jgi:hypothetical protein
VSGSVANNSNDFESLQRQLDAFLEQEKKAVITGAEQGPNELQHRLDHFINNLQQELDTFMEENPSHSSIVNFSDGNNDKLQSHRQAQPGQLEKIPAQPAKKQSVPVMAGNTNSTSYTKLISIVLIAASCVVAAILWFV